MHDLPSFTRILKSPFEKACEAQTIFLRKAETCPHCPLSSV